MGRTRKRTGADSLARPGVRDYRRLMHRFTAEQPRGVDPQTPARVEQPLTLAHHLERDRLEPRARRLELVIAALEDRAVYRHATSGTTPEPLTRAIVDSRSELTDVRRLLILEQA